jgi:hypothetical protein
MHPANCCPRNIYPSLNQWCQGKTDTQVFINLKLSPSIRIVFEKWTAAQITKEFSANHVNGKFIFILTRTRLRSLFRTTWIQIVLSKIFLQGTHLCNCFIHSLIFQISSSFQIIKLKFAYISGVSLACYILLQSHPLTLGRTSNSLFIALITNQKTVVNWILSSVDV